MEYVELESPMELIVGVVIVLIVGMLLLKVGC